MTDGTDIFTWQNREKEKEEREKKREKKEAGEGRERKLSPGLELDCSD